MFNSIAKDYYKLNHILSLGVDRTWRKRAIKYIAEDKPQQILDIACGTGDFSLEIARRTHPGTMITGLDLSEGMLEVMDCKVAEAGLSERIHTHSRAIPKQWTSRTIPLIGLPSLARCLKFFGTFRARHSP